MQQMPLQFQLCSPIPEEALVHRGLSSDKESSSEAGAVDKNCQDITSPPALKGQKGQAILCQLCLCSVCPDRGGEPQVI